DLVEVGTLLQEEANQENSQPHHALKYCTELASDTRIAGMKPLSRWSLLLLLASCAPEKAAERPPNIVLILTDDQGYADIGCFGGKGIRTPNLDRMAAEGMRFTDFYVGQAVCTASRAALMTGCYPNRVGLQGALNHQSPIGIHESELLLPQLCKSRGYATAAFGKWHLGCQEKFLPTRHGFDEFFGIPYSND